MEGKYYKQTVEIVMDREEVLYKRIAEVAEQTGESFESIFNLVAIVGIAHSMDVNLKHLYEGRLRKTEVETIE